MMQIIPYTTEWAWLADRAQDITSTEVSCLFGCSPYLTAFELWHRKKSGIVPEFQATERTEWGLALQDSIACKIASQQGWKIRRMDEYIRDPERRMGASFDFAIEGERAGVTGVISDPGLDGLLEIKNLDSLQYKRGWIVEGDNIEAPAHIELQVQQQLMVSGRLYAYIGALVGGNTMKLLRREPMPDIIAAIRQKVAAFWESIDAGIEPSPVFPADNDAVIRLSQYAEPGKIIAGTPELAAWAREYKRIGDEIKERTEQRDTLKAEILLAIGDAEKVNGEGYTISAGITGEVDISFTRKAFRNFRVSWKGEK